MITKGVTQEQKPATLVSFPDMNTNVGNSTTETTIFQRDYDFSKIDYLASSLSGVKSGAGGSGLSYLYVYINGVLKQTLTYNGATPVNSFSRIDCTSITGVQTLKVSYLGVVGTEDIIINGIFIGVVDS